MYKTRSEKAIPLISILMQKLRAGGMALLALTLLLLLSGSALVSNNGKGPFTITSPDFKDGGALSERNEFGGGFGCHGDNIAPTLQWTGVPTGTKSFAFTINDVDAPVAGGFHHWVVFNIPANVRELHNNPSFDQGTNSFPMVGYDGPCPPPDGQIHHYIFTVYALSVDHIDGDKTLTYEQLLGKIAKDVRGISSTVGTFARTTDN